MKGEIAKKNNEVELVCFVEHMMSANNLMAEPYNMSEMLNILFPIMGFAPDVINPQTTNLICNDLSDVIDKLIEDGVL
jgi:hypothetical protein